MREGEPQMTDVPAAEAVARDFLDRLTSGDVDGAISNFAADGVAEWPFAFEPIPTRIEGRDAIHAVHAAIPSVYSRVAFHITATYPMSDPEWVAVEYRGDMETVTGAPYQNTYVSLFRVVDEKIVLFREHYNPLVLQAALGDAFEMPD